MPPKDFKAQFKALFLSRAPPLVPCDADRKDLQAIDDLLGTLRNTRVAEAEIRNVLNGIANFFNNNPEFLDQLMAATNWVNSSLDLFYRRYNDQPPDTRNPKAVYFIISPQFALNGHRGVEVASPVWDARAAPHEDIEQFIARLIRERLATDERYRNLRIVFVFSMCTYSTFVLPPSRERFTETVGRDGSVSRTWTIGAANRLTVITSAGQIRQVHKFNAIGDNWRGRFTDGSRMFSPKYIWNEWGQTKGTPVSLNTLGIEVNVPPRAQEIAPLELPEQWQDNNGERIRLTFGSGSDSYLDRVHGKCNLSIFLSGDMNVFDVVDINRPFLRNDPEFWEPRLSGRAALAKQPGYYWSKPFRTMAKAVYSHILAGPIYIWDAVEAVKLTREDLLKVTDAYDAGHLIGKDWMGDLYLVKRGSVIVRDVADHTRSYGWTDEYIDFRRQKTPLILGKFFV